MISRPARLLAWGLVTVFAILALCLTSAEAAPVGSAEPDRQVLVLIKAPPQHLRAGAGYGGAYGDQLGRAARHRLAVKLAREHGLRLVDDWPMPLLGLDCFIMAVADGQSLEDAAASLAREPGVESAEVSHLYQAQGAPVAAAAAKDDPLYKAQPAAREWRLTDLHELSTGRDVRVAVIDSMVDRGHPDLAGQIQVSQDFVAGRPATAEDHGTGVAGVIAARADNGLGIEGVAPHARLMALRACWQQKAGAGGTVCDSLSLAQALHYAIDHDAQVINLSLSGPPDRLLARLIDLAQARGAQVVAAYDRNLAGGGFPASHQGVTAVAEEPLAPAVAGVYAAPGRDVPTTQPGGRWFLVNGSSYAAAHVSGLLALVRERRPLDANPLVAARAGGGAIDACASLVRASRRYDCACARPQAALAASR